MRKSYTPNLTVGRLHKLTETVQDILCYINQSDPHTVNAQLHAVIEPITLNAGGQIPINWR